MFDKMWELKKMYDKYKVLQKSLQKLVIRAKEWEYVDESWETSPRVVIDITGEMKIRALNINDESLLSPQQKGELESILIEAFQKAQNKAQEVAAEKTKEILWFDPSNLGSLFGGGMGGGMPSIPGL